MKKLGTVIICLFVTSLVYCQVQPEAYLSQIPNLPDNICSMTRAAKVEYLKNLDSLHSNLTIEIESRKKTVEENYDNSEDQMKQNIAKQYGLSESDMNKLEKDEMSEEEKQAMINKALQQKANLSIDEIKNLKKMSKEGQKAWAEAYSTEQMAKVQADPEAAKKDQNTNMQRYELAKEQSLIMQRLKAVGDKYMEKMRELDKLDSVATKERDEKRKPLMDKIEATGFETNIVEEVRGIERNYCNKLTPHYLKIIEDRYTDLKKLMPDYYRLEEVNAKLNQITTGIKKDLSSPGLIALEAVDEYVILLESAFKYSNYTFPDDYVFIEGGD